MDNRHNEGPSPGPEAPPRINPLIFPLLNFILSFCFLNYRFYLPLYLESVGIGEAGIGRLQSVFPVVTFCLIFPMGMLADRVDARRVMSLGAAGAVLFGIVGPLEISWPYLTAVMSLGAASATFSFIGINALFFKHVEEKSRGSKTGLYFVGSALGHGSGTFLGGWLIENHGPEIIFTQGTIAAIALLAASFIAPPAPMFRIRFSDYAKDIRKPAALIVVSVMFLIHTHVGAEFVSYTLLMERVAGLSGSQIGRIFIIVTTWMAVWGYAAGRFYDGSKKPVLVLAVAVLVSGIFQYITVYATDFASMAVVRLAHTFGDGLFNVIVMVLIGVAFPRGRVGGNFGFVVMVNTTAVFLSTNVSGILMEGENYVLPFMVSGIVMVAGGVALLIFRKQILHALKIE